MHCFKKETINTTTLGPCVQILQSQRLDAVKIYCLHCLKYEYFILNTLVRASFSRYGRI